MEVKDLDLRTLLEFEPKGGVVRFMGNRVILFDPVAMGLLRKELIDKLGISAARNILTRLGYAHGWLSAERLGKDFPRLLPDVRFGPAFHMLQGVVTIRDFRSYDDQPHRVTCLWEDSYEAEQHILQFGLAQEPICWTLTGFVSGYSSRVAGKETYCIEHQCVGKGDAVCAIESRLKDDWGHKIDDQLPFFREQTIDGLLKDLGTKLRQAERRLWQLKTFVGSEIEPPGIIVSSEAMEQVVNLAKRSAAVDVSVVITGESGVGKEKIARLIHEQSRRAGRPFVAINCGAISPALLESEFFGHVKGAFTGADKDRAGLFEAASGGTIFLDEVGEMPSDMQSKLLRVLQEKQVRRVGENISRAVDVKVIAATNRDLPEEVNAGRFRSDLFYRLCVIEILVPPLRERTEDILPLARFFLDIANRRSAGKVTGISPEAVEHMVFHSWPGNVRELQNVVERAVALCAGNTVRPEDLPSSLLKREFKQRENEDVSPLHEIERKYILSVVQMMKGDKKAAALKLGIGLTSLYRKLKEYGEF